jgi:glycosyltransferase involved in cell wall biosynthesis
MLPVPAIAIDRRQPMSTTYQDDNAVRGIRPVDYVTYCTTLRRFARTHAHAFDVVLEKGWRLSGLLCAAFRRSGVPGIVVENDVRSWTEPIDDVRQVAKVVLHAAAERIAAVCSRRADAVIAETDELKRLLVTTRAIPPDRVTVVPLGVDHRLFRPGDQSASRRTLGIRPDVTVLLYVGAMDEYHDLQPLIDALGQSGRSDVELHVVGGGEYRHELEVRAHAVHAAARFHGPVAHETVPQYIAAADLCLAPYRTRSFRDGALPFSTLKIPEYMACGRPAVVVPGACVQDLIVDGISGFVLANEIESWTAFLCVLPSRDRLSAMGVAAHRAAQSRTWDETAARYLAACEQVAAAQARTDDQPVPVVAR